MNLLLLCTAFILQFVGHRMGDYLFQTDWQAQNKTKNAVARLRHCLIYSLTIALLMLVAFDLRIATFVFVVTILEHFWIDSRKPIVAWKTFLERKICKQDTFNIENVPFFVVIEIDQTVHYLRILLISLLIANGII